jgi:hypothetical protein
MRRLLVVLVLLGTVLVAADRGAVLIAERVLGEQAQTEAGLASRPDVDIAGFPFLTQALAGRYEQVRLELSGVIAGQVDVERLDARLRGVQVPLGDAIGGQVTRVPVEGLDADVVVGHDELARRSGRDITLSSHGDQLRVSGEVEVLGRTVTAAAISDVRLDGDRIVVRAQSFQVGNGVADRVVSAVLGDRFDFTVRLGALPYGLRLTGLQVRQDGVHLAAEAGPTVLSR